MDRLNKPKDQKLESKVQDAISSLEDRLTLNQLIRDKTSDIIEEVYRERTTFPKE